ncbi:MAG TPA: VCBS domain-containing protein, partial [Rariglobus sp.]
LDNDNPDVERLLASSAPLSETFTYALRDTAGAVSLATLVITIQGANDAPVAQSDVSQATEQGGTDNSAGGSDAIGSVLGNDTDVDAGDTRTVTLVRPILPDGEGDAVLIPPGSTAASGAPVIGRYGVLTLGADGTYRYVLNNADPAVQALNVGDMLTEVFQYAATDAGGLDGVASIIITINGANDNPVARDNVQDGYTAAVDTATGTVTGTALNPRGNVILDEHDPEGAGTIDSDIDNPISSATVSQIRTEGGTDAGVPVAGERAVVGQYGTLFISQSGEYRYEIDSLNPALIALGPNATVSENFIYTLRDAGGGESSATLSVVIHGVQVAPVAHTVASDAIEKGGTGNGTAGQDASGDVTFNDIDPDNDALTVVNVRTGRETGSGSAGAVGGQLQGQYGTLTLNADGSFDYVVNDANAAVQALRMAGDTLIDYFTYTISDGTLQDAAELRIRIHGQNDAPMAGDQTGFAVEAGGTRNTSGGQPATGNLLDDATDVDSAALGEKLTVTGARIGNG